MDQRPELAVHPGEGAGVFQLGTGVNDVLHLLETAFLPRRPKAQVIYSSTRCFEKDIVIRLEEMGLQLRFDPVTQRLRMIDVFDLHLVDFSYQGKAFSGRAGKSKSTFLNLYSEFGPTFPGTFDAHRNAYTLQYSGMELLFELPELFQDMYVESDDLPLELPNGASPELKRMLIFPASPGAQPAPKEALERAVGRLDAHGHQLPFHTLCSTYLEHVVFRIGSQSPEGARQPTTIQFLKTRRMITLGCSVQHILSELGPPNPAHVFWKKHRVDPAQDAPSGAFSSTDCSSFGDSQRVVMQSAENALDFDPDHCFSPRDYFLNYFCLGIDLLIDGRTNRLLKVVAHSNFPGHADFSLYNKCEYRIIFPQKPSCTLSEPAPGGIAETHNSDANPEHSEEPAGHCEQRGATGANNSVSSWTHSREDCVIVTPESKWADVQSLLGPCGRPMVHDSGVAANPFGASHLYAYCGCVFQVLRNGHISDVTVF